MSEASGKRRRAGDVWFRQERAQRDAPPLTRERIVTEAVALLDEEGVARLTMRRLAERLGAGSTTLYWHVETKDDVLDLALDTVFGEVAIPQRDQRRGYREVLTEFLADLRAALLHHPWSAALLGGRPLMGPNVLARTEFLHATLFAAGLKAPHLAAAGHALSNYVIGCASTQAGWGTRDEREARWSGQVHLQAHADRYPTLAAHVDMLDDDWDASFGHGLSYLLDGLDAHAVPAVAIDFPAAGITDDTVTVRPLADRDAEAFAAGSRDPEVRRFAHLPLSEYTPEIVRDQIRGVIADGVASGQLAVLAIADASDDRFLGSITLFDVDPHEATAEVGFWLTPQARGLGAAGRAVALLSGWAREHLGVRWLLGRTDVENEASQDVLERCGFEPVGEPEQHQAPSGAMITSLTYRRSIESS